MCGYYLFLKKIYFGLTYCVKPEVIYNPTKLNVRKNIFEITYFETYYFANIINNILNDTNSYLRKLEDFFGNENYKNFIKPFPKFSRFHSFICFVIETINNEDIESIEIESFQKIDRKLWVELAFENFGLDYETFNDWLLEKNVKRNEIDEDTINEYFQDLILYGGYYELIEKLSEEIFFIMFLNRQILQRFNRQISPRISWVEIINVDNDDKKYFSKDGVLKRVNIPKWVQKAVFYRDRGMCVSCHKNLTGIINISSVENYDHIIPLIDGGINDVTNIQLLCEYCNKSKSGKIISTSKKYEKWY